MRFHARPCRAFAVRAGHNHSVEFRARNPHERPLAWAVIHVIVSGMKEDAEIRARALELALRQVAPGEKFGPVARLADVYARYIAGGIVAPKAAKAPAVTLGSPPSPDEYLPDM